MDNKIICKCGRKMSIYHLHKHINTKSHNNKCLLIYLNDTKKYIDDIEIILNDITKYLDENKSINKNYEIKNIIYDMYINKYDYNEIRLYLIIKYNIDLQLFEYLNNYALQFFKI